MKWKLVQNTFCTSVLTGNSGHQKSPFISELYTVFFYSFVVYIHAVQVSKCSRLWITG